MKISAVVYSKNEERESTWDDNKETFTGKSIYSVMYHGQATGSSFMFSRSMTKEEFDKISVGDLLEGNLLPL